MVAGTLLTGIAAGTRLARTAAGVIVSEGEEERLLKGVGPMRGAMMAMAVAIAVAVAVVPLEVGTGP